MVRINWTRRAQEDLKSIADFISNDSTFYAQRQIDKILNRTQALKEFPQIGKIVREYGEESIRELVLGNYRIIYEIFSDSEIGIVTIHHSARDLSQRKIK